MFQRIKNIKLWNKKLSGFSLVEIMLAFGLFAFALGTITSLAINSFRIQSNNTTRLQATAIINSELDSLYQLKNSSWSEIIQNSDGNPKNIQNSDGILTIVDGEKNVDNVEISFSLNPVERDIDLGIVPEATGGDVDISTRKVVYTANWTDSLGRNQTFNIESYINNWTKSFWELTTEAEFNTGTNNDTIITSNTDGEVQLDLQYVVNGDWCNPAATVTSYDIPGQGDAQTIQATPGNAYMGTGGNSSGLSFIKTRITDSQPPEVIVDGTFDGYKTNEVFGEENYAYLATDDNQEEIVILDISQTPYQKIGWVNAPGSTNAESIYVNGNIGYFTQGNLLRTFDLSEKTGSRPLIDDHRLFARGSKTFIRGDYAYILIAGAVEELEIVDLSNPNNLQRVGWTNVNANVAVTDIYVNEAGTKAYIGGNSSSSYGEFFVIDLSSKVGNRPIISEFDTKGMSVKDIALVSNDEIAILTGVGGVEYQVVRLNGDSNLEQCGSLDVPSGVNGVAAVVFDDSGNAFTYVVTNDSSNELKVIRGGPGGGEGNGQGSQLISYGEYSSPILDTENEQSYFYGLEWTGSTLPGTNISIQVRTANTIDMTGLEWVGPDGTSSTSFASNNIENFPESIQRKRYFQYKVILNSDQINTPILENTKLSYGF